MRRLLVLAALLAPAGALAGQAQAPPARQPTAPKQPVNKDDGEVYPPGEYEKLKPIVLSKQQLLMLQVDIPGFDDVKKWSRVRKDTSATNPKTYIALPLKWPIDTRNWTAAPYALRYLVNIAHSNVLEIDVNLDGRFVGATENINQNNDGAYGPITLQLKYEDGVVVPYSLMLANDPAESYRYFRVRSNIAWNGYLPSARKRGESEKVVLFDANNNGLFDDYGDDLIKVGDKPLAPLSQLMLIKGSLYHVRMHPSGSRVQTKPYQKPLGQVDMLQNFKAPSRTRLLMLLLQNEAGNMTVDVAPASASSRETSFVCQVPVGKWKIVDGVLVHDKDGPVHVYHGEMPVIEVKGEGVAAPEWGEPFELKGDILRDITGIKVNYPQILGRSKEEYVATGKIAPVVEMSFKGRVVNLGVIPTGPSGLYEPYFYDPEIKGIYKVSVQLKTDIFGNLRLGPQEIAYRPLGD